MQLSTNKILGCDISLQSVCECGFSLVLIAGLLSERAKSLTDDVRYELSVYVRHWGAYLYLILMGIAIFLPSFFDVLIPIISCVYA